MKTVNCYFSSLKELRKFIKENALPDSRQLLIQVFTARNEADYIAQLTQYFQQDFPLACLIGATTDGEICDGKVSTHQTVISFSLFEQTRLACYISEQFDDYFQAGQILASSIVQENTKVVISFIDGLRGNGEEYLKGIHAINKDVIVAGGLAGDYAQFKKTYVFTKQYIYSHGVVGVSLTNAKLHVSTDYSFDWQAIGKKLTITKVINNQVYTIDNMSAVEAYGYYLGENVRKQLPNIGIEFPLIFEKNNIKVARAPIFKGENGSLIFAGNLKENDVVRFGCADFTSFLDATQHHINKLHHKYIETIYIYSCMARRRFIPNEIEYETSAYQQLAPASGFFTYGEFFSYGNSKELLNQSMTILALSESSNSYKEQVVLDSIDYKSTTLQALSHLINVSTRELYKLQKELELLSITDPLTHLYNRRYFINISNDIVKLAKREQTPLSVIMIDLDNFKVINDTYGHNSGDQVLECFARILQQSHRKSDIACRYGGEEFVVLLPRTTGQKAMNVAEYLRISVEQCRVFVDDQNLSFTISLGISELCLATEEHIDKVLIRADKALYQSKKNGKNKISVL